MMMQKLISRPFSMLNRKSVYPGFMQRGCTVSIDLVLLLLLLVPFDYCLNYLLIDRQLFTQYEAWQNAQMAAGSKNLNLAELKYHLVNSGLLVQMIVKNVMLAIIGSGLLVLSWYYLGTTPGKWFFRLYVVDNKTGGKPTLNQLICRAASIIFTIVPLGLGYLFIFTNKKHRAIHDYLSRTVVVKREI